MSNTVSLKPGADARRLQHLDQHRALDVLLQRLRDGQLLREFDVVADGRHVDAGPRHLDRVVHLHGLAFDHPAAREPRERDVLRHLGVRAGGGPERGRGAAVAEGDGEVASRIGLDEALRGKIEDRPLLLQLAEHAADEDVEGNGSELDHGLTTDAEDGWVEPEPVGWPAPAGRTKGPVIRWPISGEGSACRFAAS